jgi:Leucine-rich repeat (LRR) protein
VGQIPSSLYEIDTLKTLLLSSNKLSGKLAHGVVNFKSLENLSLFDNNLEGQVPLEIEKLRNLKEMNISYNMFSGLVSKNLASLDTLNMTMLNDKGVAIVLEVAKDNTAIASED